MFLIEPIRRPPENFHAFVDEVAVGLTGIYGLGAAEDYRRKAPTAILSSLSHPAVHAWVTLDARNSGPTAPARAMLVAATRDGMGHITFIHVLERFAKSGDEAELVRAAVTALRAAGVEGISAEPVTMCDMALDEVFASLGFQRVERQLMAAPLHARAFRSSGLPESCTAEPADFSHIADVIVDAYCDHPGRDLHSEVRTRAGAESFIRTAAEGAYGQTRPSFIRVIRRLGAVVGAIVGCEAAPGVGFILQVVVRKSAHGQGIGTRLVTEAAQCFRDAGLDRVALGVTNDNPARRLYERLGFRKILPVNAYVWWK